MGRFIAYLLLIIVIGAGVAPWGVGMLVEQKYKKMLDQVNKLYGNELEFTVQYNRGYLISTAKTDIKNVSTGQSISFIDTIHNGPIIFNFKGWGDFTSYIPTDYKLAVINTKIIGPVQQIIQTVYGDKPAYDIITRLDYSGAGITEIKIYPLQTKVDGMVVDWQGGQYNTTFDSELTKFNGDLNISTFSYTEMDSSLKVSKITGTYNNDLTTMASDFSLNVSDIAIMEAGLNVLEVKDVTIKANGSVKDDLLTGDLDYAVGSFSTESDKYGPINLSLKIKNINMKLANELSNEMEVTPESDQKLLDLLSKGPVFDIAFVAVAPQGNVNIVTHVEIGGPELKDVNTESILKTLKVTSDVKIAAAIVKMFLEKYVANEVLMQESMYFMQNRDNANAAPNPYVMTEEELSTYTAEWVNTFTDYLITNNYITESSTDYITNIQLSDDVVTVNGTVRSDEDLDALESSMQVVIESETVQAPTSTESQQPLAPSMTPTPEMPDQMQTPPSQLQPMTEEEAQERLDSVPTTTPQPAI